MGLDSATHHLYNRHMKKITQKRIALLFVSLLVVLVLIPAFHWAEDDSQREDCPTCRAYGQLFAVVGGFAGIDVRPFWTQTAPSTEIACILPNAFPLSSESRAPPA